jgi:hypothetical protein
MGMNQREDEGEGVKEWLQDAAWTAGSGSEEEGKERVVC